MEFVFVISELILKILIHNFFFKPTLTERAANDLHFSQKLSKNNFFWRRNEFLKKTLEIPKIRIAHISKFLGRGGHFLGVFEGQKYKIELFTPRAESPEGYYYHGCGRAAGRPGGRARVSCDTFFHSIF